MPQRLAWIKYGLILLAVVAGIVSSRVRFNRFGSRLIGKLDGLDAKLCGSVGRLEAAIDRLEATVKAGLAEIEERNERRKRDRR